MIEIDNKVLEENIKIKISDYIDMLPIGNDVCHPDFHPDNLIITKYGPRINDWSGGSSGYPCEYAAITTIIFTLCNKPPVVARIINLVTKMLARYIKKRYLKGYLLLFKKTL